MMVISFILAMKSSCSISCIKACTYILIVFSVQSGRTTRMSSINPVVQIAQQLMLGGAVKQNHALEHATIVLLSKKYPDVRLAGISFAAGFFVFGDLPTEAILPAAEEALRLLRSTSPDLAIHERCGTNLAVTGIVTSLAAMTVAKMRRPYG